MKKPSAYSYSHAINQGNLKVLLNWSQKERSSGTFKQSKERSYIKSLFKSILVKTAASFYLTGSSSGWKQFLTVSACVADGGIAPRSYALAEI